MKRHALHIIFLLIIIGLLYLLTGYYNQSQRLQKKYQVLLAAKKATAHHTVSKQALNQPNMDNFGIQVWANTAAVRAYTFDFLNYKNQFASTENYFTPKAWPLFQAALKKSGTLPLVLTQNMVVAAVATGSVIVTPKGAVNGLYTWEALMPLQVTLANSRQKITQHLNLTMTIVRAHPNTGIQGLAIQSFNADKIPSSGMLQKSASQKQVGAI